MMTRYFSGLLYLFVMTMTGAAGGVAVADERPNLLFMMADDMGWHDASSFGDAAVETPNIDALAREGMKWTQFYAASAVCTPTRVSVLTGRYPLRFDVRRHFRALKRYLPTAATTLAERLRDAGYATAHVGKWHLGGLHVTDFKGGRRKPGQVGPPEHGFDWYQTRIEQNPEVRQALRARNLYRNGGTVLLRNDQVVTESDPAYDKHLTDITGDTAARLIRQYHQQDRPFFLNVWWLVPHKPYEPAPEPHWADTAADGISDDQHRFRSMMAHMDAKIGKIIQTLKDTGEYDNTLIVFTSDNGAAYEGRIGPLKGGKTDLHEGGVRVPAVFTWPGRIPAGTTTDTLGHTNDILPTFCAAAGVELPDDQPVDGINLLPHLTRREPIPHARRFPVFWQLDLYGHLQRHYPKPEPYATEAVRDGPWKLLARNGRPVALYHIENDLAEEHNLIDQHPRRVEKLTAEVRDFLNAPRLTERP